MDTHRWRIGHVSVSDTYRIRDTLLPRRIEVTQMDGEEGRKRMEEGKGRESPLRPFQVRLDFPEKCDFNSYLAPLLSHEGSSPNLSHC